jgi:hypothetical protein
MSLTAATVVAIRPFTQGACGAFPACWLCRVFWCPAPRHRLLPASPGRGIFPRVAGRFEFQNKCDRRRPPPSPRAGRRWPTGRMRSGRAQRCCHFQHNGSRHRQAMTGNRVKTGIQTSRSTQTRCAEPAPLLHRTQILSISAGRLAPIPIYPRGKNRRMSGQGRTESDRDFEHRLAKHREHARF